MARTAMLAVPGRPLRRDCQWSPASVVLYTVVLATGALPLTVTYHVEVLPGSIDSALMNPGAIFATVAPPAGRTRIALPVTEYRVDFAPTRPGATTPPMTAQVVPPSKLRSSPR